MKRILFVAIAVTLLVAGCQKTEIINRVGDSMVFSTEMNKLTKSQGDQDAAAEGEVNLKAQDFKVWAYCAYVDANNNVERGEVYDGMAGLDVTWDGSKWGTTKEYYWPGTDKSLDFFAVSTKKAYTVPADGETPAVPGVEVTPANPGLETIGTREMTVSGYAVDNNNPNDDLMVAEFVRQHQAQNSKKVNLHFKHALAKIVFKFKTVAAQEGEVAPKVVVKSLTVADLVVDGTLKVTETTEGYGEEDPTRAKVALAWTLGSTLKPFADDYITDYTFDSDVETGSDDTTAMELTTEATEFATWLVIPQGIEEKKVSITYVINKREFTNVFSLSKGDLKSWDINQAVTYTVTLAPNVISFNPTVEDWTIYDADANTEGNQDVDMMN